MGFTPDTSGDGLQHRWLHDAAQVDVLIPEGVGERAAARHGIAGAPTVPAPGTTQALQRSEPILLQVGSRVGTVLRPNVVGALVGKAAARTEIAYSKESSRHCVDFVILASLVSVRDFRGVTLTRKDRQRLQRMLEYTRKDDRAMGVANAPAVLNRLERVTRGTSLGDALKQSRR